MQSVKVISAVCISFPTIWRQKVETEPLQYNHLTQEPVILVLILNKYHLIYIIRSAEFVQTV